MAVFFEMNQKLSFVRYQAVNKCLSHVGPIMQNYHQISYGTGMLKGFATRWAFFYCFYFRDLYIKILSVR